MSLVKPITSGVAVIVPYYKAGKFASDLVKSLATQTYPPDEIVIVDDGNGDGVDELIHWCAIHKLTPKMLHTEGRVGPACARNFGLDATSCRYVAFLDADDVWLPAVLAELMRAVADSISGLACGSPYYFVENRKVNYSSLPEQIGLDLLLQTNPIVVPMVLIDRGRVGQVRFENCGHEDYRLWLRLTREYGPFFCVNKQLVGIRRVPGSVSSNKRRAAYWHWQALRDLSGLSLPSRCVLFALYALNASYRRKVNIYKPILLPGWLLKKLR